jgi:superfamily II DNA or RNA helicase
MTKPTFATNRDGETVAAAINGLLDGLVAKLKEPPDLAIATAYFNPGGYSLLADALAQLGKVRILIGADPEPDVARVRPVSADRSPQREGQARLRAALTGHARSIEQDRDLLGFDLESDLSSKRLIEWLESDSVEVRRYTDGFLHGKAFLVTTGDEAVLAGSSNFTYAGLAKNLELNLGHYDPHVVSQVRSWLEELWDHAEPFDLASIYAARYQPHSPYLIYLRMLWERYGEEVKQEAEAEGTRIRLATFQRDGVWRAKRILDERNGVVVADGVGLGKTFIAGELIREAVEERRQRVLVVAPAALRDGPWAHFIEDKQLPVRVVSFEELTADPRLNPESTAVPKLRADLNEYAMVVVDEAHAYRTPETQRAAALRKLLQGSPPKKVVMLTATPVNNTLWDLYYLLGYFIHSDSAFADAGIHSLREEFAEAMKQDPDDLSAEGLFDVLDAVAVRRTRHFVKTYYPSDQVDGKPIVFPKPRVEPVEYSFGGDLADLFARVDHALRCGDSGEECQHDPAIASEPVLSLARYAPSRYRVGEEPESYELQLAGLLRTGLLKRFESSAHAFALTCDRMAQSHDHFLELLEDGHVVTGEALREWAATDADDVDELVGGEGDVTAAALYDAEALRSAAEADRALLHEFAAQASKVTPENDPKLAELADALAGIAAEARTEAIGEDDERDKRKVLVFSYYADTVAWIAEYLEQAVAAREDLAAYRGRIETVTGGSDSGRSQVLFGFAPRSAEAPSGTEDRYDVLVTTDVLAEGVNLQQARHIINFDLPWNPMRLVQRHGRIDRIGSEHRDVFIRCFLPDRELDALLELEATLNKKLSRAAKSIGVESEVLPGSAVSDQTFAETREEIARLRAQDPTLFETGGETGGAYSGEEYRQALRAGLQDPRIEEMVKSLPWGSGSGKVLEGGVPGFVFCARVGDHPRATYRFVPREGSGDDEVIGDTLACLSRARADADTVRDLDEADHAAAYDAWASARADIFEQWQRATDPANLQPRVPKVLRDAAQLIRETPPAGFEQRELDRVIDALEAPYGTRIQKLVRDAIRGEGSAGEQATAVVRTVQELGLEPAAPPEPLPVIALDDVHLVCWMAIVEP